MYLILIILAAAGAVTLGAWSVSTALESRSGSRRSLRSISNYETVTVREQEMLERLGDRVIGPATEAVVRFARRFTPTGYVEGVRHKIVLAGNPPGLAVDRFLILKVLGAGSGIFWVPFGIFVLGDQRLFAIVFVAFAWLLCFMGPDIVLDNKIRTRREEIARSLSDTLDLLVISVEAGLGFEQALDRTANTVPGPLSDELRRMLQETRMGASRADALRALDVRTDVEELRTFIIAMLQADTFGVSVSRILRNQADEIRDKRRSVAQEKSQKAPIRMLFPLVVCIFPSIFVVMLLPALFQVFDKLK